MNTNQHRSAAFKWQGVLCASLTFVSLFGTAIVPLPCFCLVVAAAVSEVKAGHLEVEGRGGNGGDVSSGLRVEQLEVAGEEDRGKKKRGGIFDLVGHGRSDEKEDHHLSDQDGSITHDANTVNKDGMGRVLEDDPISDFNKPFTIDSGMRELKDISHRLRGSGTDGDDSAGILHQVRDLAMSYLKSIKVIQGHFEDGNSEKAVEALKAAVGEADILNKGDKKGKKGNNIGLFQSLDSITSTDVNPFITLSDIPDAQLAEFMEPQVFDDLAEHTQELVNVLEGVDKAVPLSTMQQEKKKKEKGQASEGFVFDSNTDSGSGPNGRKPHIQFRAQDFHKYHANDFLSHPSIKDMLRPHMSGIGSRTTQLRRKFGVFFQNDDTIMAKHQARQESLGVCPKVCDPDEVTCHCENLFACVGNITKYDLAVLIAGGFIDTKPESQNFGNFTVSAESLYLFDAEEGVKDKLARIQANAIDHQNLTQCKAVLGELFTACDPSKATCSNPNTESFQVSTEQVCAVVNTPKKLLFEVIGDEFDGFDDEQAVAKCGPLSFEVCRDFVAEFDRLYKSSSETNPMRKNSNSLYDEDTQSIFQLTQFPTEYWYPQDERGIADRSFSYPARYVVCGSGGYCDGVKLQNVFPNDLHAFRCCSDKNLDIADDGMQWRMNEGCAVYWGQESGCHEEMTYAEATAFCEASEARLCTKEELLDGCAEGSLCGLNDNLIWSSSIITRNAMAIVNPATGKALGLAPGADGTDCGTASNARDLVNYGPRIEIQDYDPYDPRQYFVLENSGKIRSDRCRKNGDTLYLTPEDVTADGSGDTKQCIGGSTLILRRGGNIYSQKWKAGVDGTIAIDVDCTEYQTGSLVVTTIEDNDIEHYENVYFSFVNPASGLALSVAGTDCGASEVTTVQTYERNDDDQKFKLLKSRDGFFIESKSCADQGRSLLSALDCTRDNAGLVLGGDEICIKAVTGGFDHANGYLHVYVDSGDGYVTVADGNFAQNSIVFEQCFDRVVGVQVHGPDNNAWGGRFRLSLDGGDTYPDEYMFTCLDCTGSSNTMPIAVAGDDSDLGRDTKCKNGRTCTLAPPENIHFDRQWKINDGKLELEGCGTVASISSLIFSPPVGTEIQVSPDDDSWSQEWTAISHDAILKTENGESNQEWKTNFVRAPYNYALLPQQSFPGTVDTDGCLSSTYDPEVSKAAMHYCDASMSLLIGSQTSLGTLRAIANVVEANGLDYMPGSCCFDSPTSNDEYFGIDYDPNLMTCQNTGQIHLRISEEACESAGGKWFRTPCITLKEAIDARPFKFDIGNPLSGSCQDALLQVNTAYVEASTDHTNFTFTSDELGCNEFCRSLPDYTNQIAMMTGGSTDSTVDSCVCVYQNGGVPSADLLPGYATRSPPKFSLIDPINGMALGISSGYDCTADEIVIEAQDNVNSARHQFYLSYDQQLVNAACPGKLLTATCGGRGVLVLKNLLIGISASKQQWSFNDGIITSLRCPSKQISAIKADIDNLESFYFSLVNPATSLAMGVDKDGSCVDGMDITLQNAIPGSPSQQFYIEESGEIVSVMCPELIIAENLAPSSAPSMAPTRNSNGSLSPTNSLIPDDECNHKNLQLKARDSVSDTWHFNDDGSIGSHTCSGKVIDIETGGKLSARTGAAMILSDNSEDKFSMYQKWTKSRLQLSIKSGPYSLLNPASGFTVGVEDGNCANGMALTVQADDHTISNQQFYLGSGGAIHSVKCHGLVIAAPSYCAQEQLTLQTATGDDSTKWIFSSTDGSIESVECPGYVIDVGGGNAGSDVMLQSRGTNVADSQVWRKVNTRLLAANQEGWSQNWDINFDEEYDGLPTPSSANMTCYEPNSAFSASFEDFAKQLVIDDAADEDECRNAREKLGFERDHPYDTEVRDVFNDYMCNIVEFTAVDHMTEGLSDPPTFTQIEFEAPEYPDDPGLTFDPLPTHDPIEIPDKIGSFDELDILRTAVTGLKAAEGTFRELYYGVLGKYDSQCSLVGRSGVPIINPTMVVGGSGGGGEFYSSFPFFVCMATNKFLEKVYSALWWIAWIARLAVDIPSSRKLIKTSQVLEEYHYAKATFNSLQNFDSWNFNALETINKNIFKQHSEMREHLQDRHQAMTTDIVEFLEQSTNVIGNYFTVQTDWLHENLCLIFKEVSGSTNCDGTQDNLLGLVGLSLWDKMLRIEAQGESLTKEIQMARSTGVDGETGGGTQGLLQVGTEAKDLESVRAKMDVFESKMGAVGSKMDAVEEKIDAVEVKMGAIEGKVDAVEANMQEVKEKMETMEGNIREVNDKMETMGEMITKMMSMLAKDE